MESTPSRALLTNLRRIIVHCSFFCFIEIVDELPSLDGTTSYLRSMLSSMSPKEFKFLIGNDADNDESVLNDLVNDDQMDDFKDSEGSEESHNQFKHMTNEDPIRPMTHSANYRKCENIPYIKRPLWNRDSYKPDTLQLYALYEWMKMSIVLNIWSLWLLTLKTQRYAISNNESWWWSRMKIRSKSIRIL